MVGIFPLSWYLIEQAFRALEGRRLNLPWHRVFPAGKRTDGFALWIGEATGYLASLRHGAGIARKASVVLALPDAAQNILVLGGIGSGKTTRAMNPLLLQLLDQDAGGLIFNIKGNVGPNRRCARARNAARRRAHRPRLATHEPLGRADSRECGLVSQVGFLAQRQPSGWLLDRDGNRALPQRFRRALVSSRPLRLGWAVPLSLRPHNARAVGR